jgi:quercetin dioxygenase-like cupin family protein
MPVPSIPFHTTDWASLPATEHPGDSGVAIWRTMQYGDLRVRVVEYSSGYQANHWCSKGHILYCLRGELITELSDGSMHRLTAGMSYQVSDEMSRHRSRTENGAVLFIVDGNFLTADARQA